MMELIVIALAVARLTVLLVKDDIFESLRESIWYISPPTNDDATGRYFQSYRKATKAERAEQRRSGLGIIESRYMWSGTPYGDRRKAGFWGQVISCPDCMGVYVSAAAAACYWASPEVSFWIALPFAFAMITSLIARRY